MVVYKKEFGQKETDALVEFALNSKQNKKTAKRMKIIFSVLGAVYMAMSFQSKDWVMLFIGVAFVLLAWILFPYLSKRKLKKYYNKLDPRLMKGTYEYRVDDSGIEIVGFASTSKLGWEVADTYGENENFIWLKNIDNRLLLFDKAILSEEESKELHELLAAHNVAYDAVYE